MRRERYVFNKQTLRYETVVEPISTTILRIFGFVCGAALTAFIFTMVVYRYFPSPKEKEQQAVIQRLNSYIEDMNTSVDKLDKVASNLQDRDAHVHRMVLGMEPIDDNIWDGGVGGHDLYQDLASYGDSGEAMAAMQQRLDKLKHRMTLQSRSLDTILNMARNKEERLAAMPTIKPVSVSHLSKGISLMSGFGPRLHPIYKVMRMHNGIDFTAPTGTPIQATGDGVVEKAEYSSGYGNLVVINHGYGYKTYYAHMSKIDVSKGTKVSRGQTIGRVGSTGASTAPHCHYEVHVNGKPVNPVSFVMDGLSPEEYKALTEAASTVNHSFHH